MRKRNNNLEKILTEISEFKHAQLRYSEEIRLIYKNNLNSTSNERKYSILDIDLFESVENRYTIIKALENLDNLVFMLNSFDYIKITSLLKKNTEKIRNLKDNGIQKTIIEKEILEEITELTKVIDVMIKSKLGKMLSEIDFGIEKDSISLNIIMMLYDKDSPMTKNKTVEKYIKSELALRGFETITEYIRSDAARSDWRKINVSYVDDGYENIKEKK